MIIQTNAIKIYLKCIMLLACSLAVLNSTCNRHIITPPLKVWEFETAKTAEPNQAALILGGGMFIGGTEFIGGEKIIPVVNLFFLFDDLLEDTKYDDYSGISTTASFRKGIFNNFHLSADFVLNRFDTPEIKETNPFIRAFRASAKYDLSRAGIFSLQAGFGAGSSAGGFFISYDAGFTLSYENDLLSPYINYTFAFNKPLENIPVFLGNSTYETLTDSYSHKVAAGFKLPFGFNKNLKESYFAYYMEYVWMWLRDENDEAKTFFLGLGLAYYF